jgi:hydrogenase nickel incorporation protein HypA/HybF
LPPGNGTRVAVVRVRVGELSGVVPESLEFCFSAVTSGTQLEGTHLAIDRVPLTGSCPSCGRTGNLPDGLPLCPDCGSPANVLTGDELLVAEMELLE